MKNGTSEPISAASCASFSSGSAASSSSFSPSKVAAASLLPPASPAPCGICFCSSIRRPVSAPTVRKKSRAARTTRLSSPVGSEASSQTKSMTPARSVAAMVIESKSEIGAISVSISWKPSSRRPRIRKERLIFAGARSCIDWSLFTACAEYRMDAKDEAENPQRRLIVALDFPTPELALDLVADLAGEIAIFKIGLQLYTAAGPEIVRRVAATGAEIFLDLKLHDIPNTVAKAVEAAAALRVRMLTIHLSGGRRMIEAATAACPPELLLLGVTVLTSSDETTLRETGVARGVEEQTLELAALGAAAGIRGLIASPH